MYIYAKSIQIYSSHLKAINARGSDFSFCKISDVLMQGSNLKYTDLNSCTLKEVKLAYSNLSGAELKDAYCKGLDLREANLEGASFKGVIDLTCAQICGAIINHETRFPDYLQIKLTSDDPKETSFECKEI